MTKEHSLHVHSKFQTDSSRFGWDNQQLVLKLQFWYTFSYQSITTLCHVIASWSESRHLSTYTGRVTDEYLTCWLRYSTLSFEASLRHIYNDCRRQRSWRLLIIAYSPGITNMFFIVLYTKPDTSWCQIWEMVDWFFGRNLAHTKLNMRHHLANWKDTSMVSVWSRISMYIKRL